MAKFRNFFFACVFSCELDPLDARGDGARAGNKQLLRVEGRRGLLVLFRGGRMVVWGGIPWAASDP